nr:acyltransferase family protein [Burkholderiaceae bacterium]
MERTAIGPAAAGRQQWIDHARGLCIVLIVMLHSRYAVGDQIAVPLFDSLIEAVRPFRLPALFLVSGLFLARLIDRPWPEFLDRRVVYYAYFYVLWASLEFAPALATGLLRDGEPASALATDYAMLFIAPHGPLWFIYALPFFFVIAKLLRRVPGWVVLPIAALVSMADLQTGWVIGDRIASRYFYFHAGYVAAPMVFAAGRWAAQHPGRVLPILAGWLVAHLLGVMLLSLATDPAGAFALGVAGSAAVLLTGAVLSRTRAANWLAYLGSRSLIVYLAFPLLLIVVRKALEFSPVPLAGDLRVLLIMLGSMLGALLIHRMLRNTPLRVLFERPAWATL